MMNTIAPVWDGDETWLVLGGTGLLGAFPLAYAVIMPVVYLPIILMLAGLILRRVAFEFRIRGRARGKRFWTIGFATGSILAAVAQGFVLGGFIQGFTVRGGQFAGRPFDWLTPYTVLVAFGLVAGYALLGAAYAFTFQQAAAADNALGLMLAGTSVLLPLILLYTVFVYWTFRGKVTPDAGYH